MSELDRALDDLEAAARKEKPTPALLGAYINGSFQKAVPTDPAKAYFRHLDNTPGTAYHHNAVSLVVDGTVEDENRDISLYYDEFNHLAIWGLTPPTAGANLQNNANSGAGGVKRVIAGTNVTITGTLVEPVVNAPTISGGGLDLIALRDAETSGTNGGSVTLHTWTTRVLNTIDADTGSHCSLASNQFTFDAGTYRVAMVRTPAFQVGRHICRIYDVTNGAVLQDVNSNNIVGSSAYAEPLASSFSGYSDSVISGRRFTLSGSTVLRIEHWVDNSVTTNGLGQSAGSGEAETYTVAVFEKE